MNARTRSDILAAASGRTSAQAARVMVERGGSPAPSNVCDDCGEDMGPIFGAGTEEDDGEAEARRVLLETVEFAIDVARGENR
jgi:hypothetical protein